jgi:hypothetical protein
MLRAVDDERLSGDRSCSSAVEVMVVEDVVILEVEVL